MRDDVEYVGLRVRAGAAFIDGFLILALVVPLYIVVFGVESPGGWGLLCQYLFASFVIILFWQAESATLGKVATHMKIVDARSGAKPTAFQFAVRYLAYALSVLPLCLGILWIALDRRKQGWHDKLAGTVVVRSDMYAPAIVSDDLYELDFRLEEAAPVVSN